MALKSLQQNNVDEIRKAAKLLAIIFGCVSVVLVVAYKILEFWKAADWYLMTIYIVVYTGCAMSFLCLLSFIVYLIMNQRDSQEDKLREELSSHLKEVTEEQEKQILQLLKRAAIPSDGSNKINRAEVATFLATLKSLGHLEDAGDYNNLRLWVEKETGLSEPDKGHFNEAYKRALERRGDTRYTQDLREILR